MTVYSVANKPCRIQLVGRINEQIVGRLETEVHCMNTQPQPQLDSMCL